jgi:hypothetical protein
MADPTTTYKGYAVQTTGSNSGTWGGVLNDDALTIIDNNLGQVITVNASGSNITLTSEQSQANTVRVAGVLSANIIITTAAQGFTFWDNVTTGSYTVSVYNGVGSVVVVPQGQRALVLTDVWSGARLCTSSTIDSISSNGFIVRKSSALTYDAGRTAALFCKDNNGVALLSGIAGDMTIPFACTIKAVTVLADVTGSMVIDLWKAPYASYPPTGANSICLSSKPTLSSATKYTDSTLSGWTTSVNADDVIRVNVDSVSTITRFTVSLSVERFS